MAAALVPNNASNKAAAMGVLAFAALVSATSLLRLLLAVISVFFEHAMERDKVPLTTEWVHVTKKGQTSRQFSTVAGDDSSLLVIASLRDNADSNEESELETPTPAVPSSSTLEEVEGGESITPIEVEAIKERTTLSTSSQRSSATISHSSSNNSSSMFSSSSQEAKGDETVSTDSL